jgi:hypothetical protein
MAKLEIDLRRKTMDKRESLKEHYQTRFRPELRKFAIN